MYPKEQTKIISYIKKYVKTEHGNDVTGHDWWHIYRVWKIASYLTKKEKRGARVDFFVVQLASLLHDLEDWKLNHRVKAKSILEKLNVEPKIVQKVCTIIDNISFKGAKVRKHHLSLEGKIVQDADRLDALGAIGIARAFAYGGNRSQLIYEPKRRPILHSSFKKYKTSRSSTINHFYEKLLFLKKQMNTKTAKRMAKKRDELMKIFLSHFFAEWNLSDLNSI